MTFLLSDLALPPGSQVALVAPARAATTEQLQTCTTRLEEDGYTYRVVEPFVNDTEYLAGSDADRAQAIMDAFLDAEVDAIWCVNGGYGSARILPYLDYDLIASHPKPFIGFSDITAFLNTFAQRSNLITYHAPTFGFFCGQESDTPLTTEQAHPLVKGIATGPLLGGNLTVLTSLVGTEFQPNTEGALLLLEEIGEEPYRIDRMLEQLSQAGMIKNVAGVILGSFRNCAPENPERALSLEEVLDRHFKDAPYPVLINFPSGHIHNQIVLPIGEEMTLDTEARSLIPAKISV